MYKISSIEMAEDLVQGAAVLGTGGGGDPNEGLKLLKDALEAGKTLEIIGLDELPEGIVVTPYYIGTIAPTAKTRKPIKITDPMATAFESMEKILGEKIGAVVACEIGGLNTPIALAIGAKMGIPMVDGDLMGRAGPELHQCTVHIFDVPMYPSVLVTETGNVVIIERYADIDDYESMARYVSTLAGRFVAAVDTPLTREAANKVIIKGTITKCIEIGRAIREAEAGRENPVDMVVKALNGWKIFEGVVERYTWRDERGFLIGDAIVRGEGEWSGHELKSWMMNEHIMAWRDEKPIVMPPDLIAFLRDDGRAITNTQLKESMKVHVIAAKAPEVWRTPRGLELFGPRHFGFDIDYVPVEELVSL